MFDIHLISFVLVFRSRKNATRKHQSNVQRNSKMEGQLKESATNKLPKKRPINVNIDPLLRCQKEMLIRINRILSNQIKSNQKSK